MLCLSVDNDVRAIAGVVSVRVDEGDTVVMNMGGGVLRLLVLTMVVS